MLAVSLGRSLEASISHLWAVARVSGLERLQLAVRVPAEGSALGRFLAVVRERSRAVSGPVVTKRILAVGHLVYVSNDAEVCPGYVRRPCPPGQQNGRRDL